MNAGNDSPEDASPEPRKPWQRQGGLVAGTAHTRIPEELLEHAGSLGIPIQALAMYVHVVFFDRGRGKPFVGLATIAGRMGMSRTAAWRWYEWWKNSGLLIAGSAGRLAAANVPRAAPHHATEWDWSPLYEMLFLIREAGGLRDKIIVECREKIARTVNKGLQSKQAKPAPRTVNKGLQWTVNLTKSDCKHRELGTRGNPEKTSPKQETETGDIQETEEETSRTRIASSYNSDACQRFADLSVCRRFVDLWNEICGKAGLPKARRLTQKRITAILQCLEDVPSLEDWERGFEMIAGEPCFQDDNGRGWRADINFILQPGRMRFVLATGGAISDIDDE